MDPVMHCNFYKTPNGMTDAEAQTLWSMIGQGSWGSEWLALEGRIYWSSGGPL